MEIPKKIHYCWFGGNPIPDDAKKCIESWRKYFPGYEIIEWNESNFDINVCDYVREAYAAKRWAFVSDYARFWILYHHGGLYFDTDVEIIKPYEDIEAAFMGCEPAKGKDEALANGIVINPGLGISAFVGMKMYKEVLDYYNEIHFDVYNMITVCQHTTQVFSKYGFKGNSGIERIEDITIYPVEYFCPMNFYTGELKIAPETHSIHHYSETWHTKKEIKFRKFQSKLEKKIGEKATKNIVFKLIRNLYCYGIMKTLKKLCRKKEKV